MGSDMLIVFSTKLGWMGLLTGEAAVKRLSFGHASAAEAADAVGKALKPCRKSRGWQRELVGLLQAYAEGQQVDFSHVPVELNGRSDFRRNVLRLCRAVPFGKTISYGQLAAKAGTPGAARAVGTCMAKNPLPLILPCHRVTRAGGEIGAFSAPGGTKTKRRLLAMEAASCPPA